MGRAFLIVEHEQPDEQPRLRIVGADDLWLRAACGDDFLGNATPGDFMEIRTMAPDAPNEAIICLGTEWPRPLPGGRRG